MSGLLYLETEIELAGEMRLCSVSYTLSDGEIEVFKVLAGKSDFRLYNDKGEFEPHDERVDVDVTALLSAEQIEGFELEIADALTEEAA